MGAGPFPPIRNSSPYPVIPQPGMMGNQGMIGNQGNLGNSSTGKGSNGLSTFYWWVIQLNDVFLHIQVVEFFV